MKQRFISFYKTLTANKILANFLNLSSIQISNLLLLLVTIRMVTVSVGLESFGLVMVAYRFSNLAGAVVNYGTGQSALRDTAYYINDTNKLSSLFYNTLFIRAIIFAFYAAGLVVLSLFNTTPHWFILLSIPIAFAEVVNPLCFYIGAEKIKVFNVCNLGANIVAAITIFFLIKTPTDAPWVNFILGMGNVIIYSFLLIYISKALKLKFVSPSVSALLSVAKVNFYLIVNGISANLQQSVIIFALKLNGSELLGAYSLCDRIIGQCRNLINTIANAIFPKAVNLFQEDADRWKIFRKKTKHVLAGLSFAGGVLIFTFADLIIFALSKGHDHNSVMLLRIMGFVPVISAFNVINMLDLLVKKNNVYLFKISIILLAICTVVVFFAARSNYFPFIGGFTLIVEGCALAISEYYIKKPAINHG